MALLTTKRIGITIQDNTLVIAEVSTSYQKIKIVDKLSAIILPEGVMEQGRIVDSDALRTLIREGLKKAKPHAIDTTDLIFEVPEELTFQQSFTIPSSLEESQREQAIIFEAEKILPFSIDQVSWDYHIVESHQQSQVVLFSAAPLEVVQDYYDFFLSCHLTPLGFSIRTENLLHALSHPKCPATVLLDLQNKDTAVLFYSDGRLHDYHQIGIGENDFKKALMAHLGLNEKNYESRAKRISLVDLNLATLSPLKKLAQELDNVLEQLDVENALTTPSEEPPHSEQTPVKHSKKDAKKTGKGKIGQSSRLQFIFVGNNLFYYPFRQFFKEHKNSKLGQLEGDLSQLLTPKARNPHLISNFQVHDIQGQEKKAPKKSSKKTGKRSESILKRGNTQKLLPSAIGAAMTDYSITAPTKHSINLLPPLVRSIALWKETSPWFFVMMTIILLFSVAWLMVFGFSWGNTTAQLRVAQQNLTIVERQFHTKKPKSLEERITAANQELKALSNVKLDQTPYANILEVIRRVLPEGAVFEAFQFGLLQDKTLFELKGTAPTRTQVIAVYETLRKLPFIQQVFFPASNLDEKNQIPFTVRFTLKSS
ncbi:MAG: pilus assembly protein PilM [bacterium]|nr:pilus assembly protein PilM [bacterium]